MSAPGSAPLRLSCFGAVDGSLWGAVLDGPDPALVVGSGSVALTAGGPGELTISHDGESWGLTGPDFALTLAPLDPPEGTETTDASLCAVTGRLAVGGEEQTVELPGTLGWASAQTSEAGSLRAVAGWFGPDRGFELSALRPRGAEDHERDVVKATIFDPDRWIAVDDPRLSSTFRTGEEPLRTSLELWVGPEEEQYPRRAAGEAQGPGAAAAGPGRRLHVTPLRCHSSGLEGAGVYVLAHLS